MLCHGGSILITSPAMSSSSVSNRLCVIQVIHANFLYQPAVQDIEYSVVDVQIKRSIRSMFGLPMCTPSAQIHADLGIWPCRYYADQRALRLVWRLRWQSWTKAAFQQWCPRGSEELPACLKPAWAPRGVLGRFTTIMETYGLSWADLNRCEDAGDWQKKISDGLRRRFAAYCQQAAERYHHPVLTWDKPTMTPGLVDCFPFSGASTSVYCHPTRPPTTAAAGTAGSERRMAAI